MKFLKQHKTKLILILAAIAILAGSFWWGGNAPNLRGWNVAETPTPTTTIVLPEKTVKETPTQSQEPLDEASADSTAATQDNSPEAPEAWTPDEVLSPQEAKENLTYSMQNGMEIDPETGEDRYHTTPVPAGKPTPMEPQDTKIGEETYTCTLTVRCDTILHNTDWLDPEKRELVPDDGVILPTQTVTFFEGESVFHLLLREMKKNRIHMEYVSTPIFNSSYIEGIHNLYEFDCGERSGWMYRVNGWFPNYGCSRYRLKENDVVEVLYTCDLGRDIGGYNSAAGE